MRLEAGMTNFLLAKDIIRYLQCKLQFVQTIAQGLELDQNVDVSFK